MVGNRATSAQVAAGVVVLQLTGTWTWVEIINSGSAAIGAKAQTKSAPADFALGDDDTDVIPPGQRLEIPVVGEQFDQAQGGNQPGVFVKVVAAGATGLATARGVATP